MAPAALIVLVVSCPQVFALETDQFTLPPRPLVDSGPVLSRRVYYLLQYIVRQGNGEFGKIRDSERLDERFPAIRVHRALAQGVPEASIESWLHFERFPQGLMRYNIPVWDSIFWGVFSPLPPALLQLAPTLNLYGTLLGTDKAGHFFQQGHEYYTVQLDGERAGKSGEQIRAEILDLGVKQEHGIFGTALDGVFSNADLAANYAGMKFYENLTRPVAVGARTVAPMLSFRDGRWELASDLDPDRLLEPFISEHMNEALNPSRYALNRDRIRTAVRQRCPEWHRRFPELSREVLLGKLQELSTWHGEDYGHWLPPEDAITLAGECS